MEQKKYFEINAVFELNGNNYTVQKAGERYIGCSCCVGCDLQHYCYGQYRDFGIDIGFLCSEDEREDGFDVVF